MDDLAKKILEEERLRLQEEQVRANQQSEVQFYTDSVIGEFGEVIRAIENSVIETNRNLPVNLQIHTGTLNGIGHSYLVVRGERFISLRLESITSDGWIGLRFSNGYCSKGIDGAEGSSQIHLHDNPYQLLLWAKYSEEVGGSIFRWSFSSPLPCQHPKNSLAPYDIRCNNCGGFAAASFTNQQLTSKVLFEFGNAQVPHASSSPSAAYFYNSQTCRFRASPIQEPCVGP